MYVSCVSTVNKYPNKVIYLVKSVFNTSTAGEVTRKKKITLLTDEKPKKREDDASQHSIASSIPLRVSKTAEK